MISLLSERFRSPLVLCLAFIGTFAFLPPLSAKEDPPLEYWLADQAPFWSWDSDAFARNADSLGFQWMNASKTAARAAPLTKPFFDQVVIECVVRFEDGHPDNITLSYYNRGDAQTPMAEEDFQELVRVLMTKITSTLRVQSRPGNHNSARNDL